MNMILLSLLILMLKDISQDIKDCQVFLKLRVRWRFAAVEERGNKNTVWSEQS